MYIKTPFQQGRIPRKPSKMQCQLVWCLSQQDRKKGVLQ
jgi:hypothetical protein